MAELVPKISFHSYDISLLLLTPDIRHLQNDANVVEMTHQKIVPEGIRCPSHSAARWWEKRGGCLLVSCNETARIKLFITRVIYKHM